MPKKKLSREEMREAARIAARNVKPAKKKTAPKKKEEKNWVQKLAGLLGKQKKKELEKARRAEKENAATKNTDAGLKEAGVKFESDVEKRKRKAK